LSLLNDLTLQAIFSRIFGTLIFLAVSGGVFTLCAQLLRRPGAEYEFSFSANPFTHLSVPALAMSIMFRTTWMRYRDLAPDSLRPGRWGLVIIVLVTALAGLALVAVLDLFRPLAADNLPRTLGYAVLQLIQATQQIALSSVPLSLLPLPGVTGGLFLIAIWPERRKQFRRLAPLFQGALIVLLVLGWWPDVGSLLAPWLTRG
jgi:hypothetical protein